MLLVAPVLLCLLWIVGQSTTLVQTEVSQHLLDGLPRNFVQTFMSHLE